MTFEKKYQSKKYKMHLGIKSTSLWDLVHATFPLLGQSALGPSSSQKAASSFALKRSTPSSFPGCLCVIERPARVMRVFKFTKGEQKEEEEAHTWGKASHSS